MAIPVVVNAEGSYGEIARFVRRARDHVRVRGGEVRATGRLFTVQAVELSESKTRKFPYLTASITMNAYVYDGPIVSATPLPAADAGSEDSSAGATAAKGTP